MADAGFVGYDLWQTLRTAGHHFVIRVGANVRLVRQLGWTREHAQVVYLWSDQAARKHQPPLVLRLVVGHDGKQPMYLVANLPKNRLSDRQVVTIYGARWSVCLLGTRALRTLREQRVRPETPVETLWVQLRRARLDDYQRRAAKTSRAYPRKKQGDRITIPPPYAGPNTVRHKF